jgi:hypothetical protein
VPLEAGALGVDREADVERARRLERDLAGAAALLGELGVHGEGGLVVGRLLFAGARGVPEGETAAEGCGDEPEERGFAEHGLV